MLGRWRLTLVVIVAFCVLFWLILDTVGRQFGVAG